MMLRTIAQRLTLLVCCAVVGCGPVHDRSTNVDAKPTRLALSEITVLPLLAGDRPLVQIELPGLGSARFLVDTGAEFSWISESFAERTGMRRAPLGATLTDINAKQGTLDERALIDRLELGAAVVTNFRPPIFDVDWKHIDGSLGQDLLRLLLVIIDGPGRELILAPKHSKMDTLGTFYESGASAIEYPVDWSGGTPRITVSVEGLAEDLSFLIDTGVGRMSLTQAAVDELGLVPSGTIESPGLTGSTDIVPLYPVDDLLIGKLVYTDEAMLLQHASIGWGVLRHKTLVFDNVEDSLWIADVVRKAISQADHETLPASR